MTALRIRSRLAETDGVTLAEMLVVVAILAVVLAGMTTLFVSASTSHIDQSNRVQAQQESRLALEALRREIHCASAIAGISGSTASSSIQLTLGPYCPSGGTTLTTAFTIPVAGLAGATISAADNSAFPTAGSIYVGTDSGEIVCTGRPNTTTFTGCTGGVGGTNAAAGSAITGTTTITWCTKDAINGVPPVAANRPFSLWRYRGGSCSGSGKKVVDSISETTAAPAVLAGKVFVNYPAAVAGELRVLTVGFPIDLTLADTKQRYTLRDDIALRNAPRN